MARLHLAQMAHLSQDLITVNASKHLTNAQNLQMRNKHELDRMQQIVKMLCTAYEELEKDASDDQQ